MSFTIRQLTIDDAAKMRDLRLLGLKTDPHAFGAAYETESKQPLTFFEKRCEDTDTQVMLGAFMENKLVALTSIVREIGLKTRYYAGIYAVYTHVDFRGIGISSALLKAAIDHAKTWQGVEFIKLSVTSTNITAFRIYQQAGFKQVGTLPRALREGDQYYDEHLLVLDLKNQS